jgi:hypothetical protein
MITKKRPQFPKIDSPRTTVVSAQIEADSSRQNKTETGATATESNRMTVGAITKEQDDDDFQTVEYPRLL